MADQFLPPDDESPAALLADFKTFLQDLVPGWVPSDAALEVALGAGFADEGATLYALLREEAADRFRDFGRTILGVPDLQPTPAATTTTWVARAAAPAGGLTVEAGTTLAIDAAGGPFGFEVVDDATIPEGDSSLAGIAVRAIEGGTEPNGADGPVLLDEPPAWVASVDLDAPANGGTAGDTDEENIARVIRAAQILSRAPILPGDFELVAQEVDGVARALVIDGYDHDTGLDEQERTVSIYPVGVDGQPVGPTRKTAIRELVEARREVNWVARVADPTYTTVEVEITVAKRDSTVDDTVLADAVEAAINSQILSPARHGLPLSGDRLTWRNRTQIRRYEVASIADLVEGVEYVASVRLAAAGDPLADADVTLDGPAPLPEPGNVTVTVVAAT